MDWSIYSHEKKDQSIYENKTDWGFPLMKVSVAMAAYNGAPYIEKQVNSILVQLGPEDELVISLDPSEDGTATVLSQILDDRIRIIKGPGRGVVRNFENALSECRGDYTFLADQDDIWKKNKLSTVCRYLQNGAILVVHDCEICSEPGEIASMSYMEFHNSREGFIANIIRNSFIGCCMAFRRELLDTVLPFPSHIPMHDQWIGLVAYRKGRVEFIPDKLLLYRRHSGNRSSLHHAGVTDMIRWRTGIIRDLLVRRIL